MAIQTVRTPRFPRRAFQDSREPGRIPTAVSCGSHSARPDQFGRDCSVDALLRLRKEFVRSIRGARPGGADAGVRCSRDRGPPRLGLRRVPFCAARPPSQSPRMPPVCPPQRSAQAIRLATACRLRVRSSQLQPSANFSACARMLLTLASRSAGVLPSSSVWSSAQEACRFWSSWSRRLLPWSQERSLVSTSVRLELLTAQRAATASMVSRAPGQFGRWRRPRISSACSRSLSLASRSSRRAASAAADCRAPHCLLGRGHMRFGRYPDVLRRPPRLEIEELPQGRQRRRSWHGPAPLSEPARPPRSVAGS